MPQPIRTAALCLAALLLAACQKDFSAYALTTTGKVIQFNTKKPGSINSTVTISGLGTNQSLAAMAYRPSDGRLYCITNDGFLCTLNPSSGAAAVVGTVAFTQSLGSGNNSVRLSHPVVSFDPVVDQLRVITSTYNLRINPTSGQLVNSSSDQIAFDNSDTNKGNTPLLAGIVYQNPVAGSTTATLFALDSTTGSLLRVGDKNAGNPASADGGDLRTVGSTNVSFTQDGGFAIETSDGDVFAVLQQAGTGATLFTVDLDTGNTNDLGSIGNGDQTLMSLALVPR